ncbi:hypothetical protein [Nocardiopsis deserti]|uniref:hypothetical protein n=1 Tax=Nocardiopsis deserti TaxID=2605988 RepID=UPI0029583461|nr:hypothetical protein [Nocardiopsis deserti]
MDVGAACSGFLYALEVARCWLHARPGAPPALVVGAEVYSRFVDPADRATASLFADGAGAVVLTSGDGGEGLSPLRLGADGWGGRPGRGLLRGHPAPGLPGNRRLRRPHHPYERQGHQRVHPPCAAAHGPGVPGGARPRPG